MGASIGPYQPGDVVRIPLLVTVNGDTVDVDSPRVERILLPNQTDAPGFPRDMTRIQEGTYILEVSEFDTIGNYTVIEKAELGSSTIECIVVFVIEKPFGQPRIEIACD